MKRNLRIVNVVFWIAAWATIVALTQTWNEPVLVVLEAVAPIMIGLFVHIALREHPPETP